MSYREREIPAELLEKHLKVLDSDEGIRMENGPVRAFINKTSRRYCINISNDGKDEFFYMVEPREVIEFLAVRLGPAVKIFAY